MLSNGGHQLVNLEQNSDKSITLHFKSNGAIQTAKADLVVGADGIRSFVRKLLIGTDAPPLQYLGCIVILGICPLRSLESIASSLLDSATVFQTANGHERIYIMPYTKDTVMWQLSFPMPEKEAKALSLKGPQALKSEACSRTQWHAPIPQIVGATLESHISGYPVYDRAVLDPKVFYTAGQVTLLGDAAHPMSPFKGQGANQALLDALALAREITRGCSEQPQWKKTGIRESVLTTFELEMIQRSTSKVTDSAKAVAFLHSDTVLQEGDKPRGRAL
jgi:2-polyprenyl-6-methoxyphenol hydroxylase-like FAD-dependent oxidoreductase